MTVIDVGCAPYEGEESIPVLVDKFSPSLLLAFDPAVEDKQWMEGDTWVEQYRAAVTDRDGETGWQPSGTRSYVNEDSCYRVRTVDVARLVNELPDDEIVMKLDCEGSEYPILQRLTATGADRKLSKVLVEWHRLSDHEQEQKNLLRSLRCEVEEW